MKKCVGWLRFASVGMAAAMTVSNGCISADPAELSVMDRDKLVYHDTGASEQQEEERSRVAVIVSQGDYKDAADAAKSLDSALTSGVSGMAFFELVERSNLGALQAEAFLVNLDKDGADLPDIPAADLLITAKINTYRITQSSSPTLNSLAQSNNGASRFDVAVSVDFRFYEVESKRVILTKNIEKKYPGEDSTTAKSKAAVAAQECAKAFVSDLGARYAPPARVLETRGEGKVAHISMGSNYGLAKGAKVEFFEYADHSDIIKEAKREPSIVGYGTVLSADVKSAWVEISNYKETQVKRGHYVKLRFDQSKGFRDQLRIEL